MANTFITTNWVMKDVARVLVNNLVFARNVDRSYDPIYEQGGAKVGYTVNARLPQRFRTTKGQAFQPQPISDATVPVSLTDQANVATTWSTADATTIVEDVRQRYVYPAAEQLANTIDLDGLTRMYSAVWNSVGSPGTPPSSNLTYLQAGVKLTNAAAGNGKRNAVLDPLAMATIVNANLALFNPSAKISEEYNTGQFGRDTLGVNGWYQDQNVAKHTTGTFTASTPTVNGAGQTGTSLITQAWASGATTLKKGDVFTVANVYAVNPQSYVSTGSLQDFVVQADVADASGAITFSIQPPIITSGPLQTVDSSPANGAAILFKGQTSITSGTLATTISPQSMMFLPEAFILVMADLDANLPGAEVTRVNSRSLNVSLRYVRQYQMSSDQKGSRIDALYGWTAFRPELAVRVWG